VLTKKIENPISFENAKTIVEGIIESENWAKIDYNSRTVRKAAITVNNDNSLHFWDALIAETMIENKITEIYTENTKDFEKIPGIRAINPMLP
jgi:predicted nucleic acid-binding protein